MENKSHRADYRLDIFGRDLLLIRGTTTAAAAVPHAISSDSGSFAAFAAIRRARNHIGARDAYGNKTFITSLCVSYHIFHLKLTNTKLET
jgi:hypothetical protein